MANQAIALQARAPQSNFLGGAVQQNAQLINMMSQQRAAERQAAVAQQEMELARAAEGRAVTAEERAARKAQQEYTVGRVAYFRDQLPSVKDDVSWNNWLGRVGQEDPEYADELRRASGGRYDADFVNRVSMDAKTYIDKTIATPSASLQYGEGGGAFGVTVGGMGSPRAQEVVVQPPAGAAPATAFPTTAAPATDAQIDDAARKILRGAGVGELGIGAEDFDRASERANQMKAGGNASMQPVSMTTGPQMGGQPDLASVVQDMMSSGQISQANLQLMRDTAGPANDAQLAEILRANNIRIVPDDEASMRSAVFRPGEDAAPQMQQVQSINRPGTQFRGRDPMQSPLPGSAQVPITRVREEAVAGRESPQEAAAKAAAVARANAAAAVEAKQTEKLPGRRNVSTIIGKMRSAYEQLNKMEAIPSEARGGGANFMDYLAVTRGGREVQKMFGTGPSKYLSQIETLRKQLATAIKNATGMSAQEMNSNVELQLTLDSLSDPTQGIEAALTTMADLEELYGLPKPAAGKPKTPTGQRKSLGQILGGR